VLTLQKNNSLSEISLSLESLSIDQMLSKEWLITNNAGGYASSSVVGCNTRRYHGLLIGSLNPPVDRVMSLACCLEMIVADSQVYNLSTFEFNDRFAPENFNYIKAFRKNAGVHFDYEVPKAHLTKSVYILGETNTAAIVYDFKKVFEPVDFVFRPFVGLRDFHSLQKSYAQLKTVDFKQGLLIRHDVPDSCELFLNCPDAKFEYDPQWWFNFIYRHDKQRGQDCKEDLTSAGFYRSSVDSPRRIVLWATLANRSEISEEKINLQFDIDSVRRDITKRQKSLISKAKAKSKTLAKLTLAADQLVVHCPSKKDCRTTILAGYPWFADWGRDTFISLPGVLLETGRFEEAKSVLIDFAGSCDKGMIPNKFDDRSDTAYFNSIDASLWFINASFRYLQCSSDEKTFSRQLLPVIRTIVDSYQKGTRFNTHADDDGLITAGDANTQLTWMDAKFDNVVFTPRYGKAVEINALWYNALCCLAQFYAERDVETAKYYHELADIVKLNFNQKFWNADLACLNDCILGDGTVDSSIRPNQIYAVSLPFSPLSLNRQRQIVQTVQDRLLTPFGLRTLDPADSRYIGIYTGPQEKRDQAYHQGTVWPYLIGAFIEAYLKVNDFSKQSKAAAAEFIKPLLENLSSEGCLGSIAEIYDGDKPQRPKGCFAQAWSVAELIRAYKLINSR